MTHLSQFYESFNIGEPYSTVFGIFVRKQRYLFNSINQKYITIHRGFANELIKHLAVLQGALENSLSAVVLNKALFDSLSDCIIDVAKAKYVVSRLEFNYSNDENIIKALDEIKELLILILNTSKGNQKYNEAMLKIQSELNMIYKRFSPTSPRDGTEITDTADSVSICISIITEQMKFRNHESYAKLDDLRKVFNKLLIVLKCNEIELEQVESIISNFIGTPLEKYIAIVSEKSSLSDEFIAQALKLLGDDRPTVSDVVELCDECLEKYNDRNYGDILGPLFGYYCEDKEVIFQTVLLLNGSENDAVRGLFALNSLARQLNNEIPAKEDVLFYLISGDKKAAPKAFYSAINLSQSHEYIQPVYLSMPQAYIGDVSFHIFDEIKQKLTSEVVSSLQTDISKILTNQFPLLIGSQYKDINVDEINRTIRMADEQIEPKESEIPENSSAKSLYDEILDFTDCNVGELIEIGLSSITNEYINIIKSNESDDTKSALKFAFNNLLGKFSRSNFVNQKSNSDICSSVKAFSYYLNSAASKCGPEWKNFIDFVDNKLQNIKDDEYKIISSARFFNEIGNGIMRINDNDLTKSYSSLINQLNNHRVDDIFEQLDKLQEEFKEKLPENSENINNKISEIKSALTNLPEGFYECDNLLNEQQKNLGNIMLLSNLVLEEPINLSTYGLRLQIREKKVFEFIAFKNLVESAVSVMNDSKEDASMIDEVMSLAICADIIGKSRSRRQESAFFLQTTANQIKNTSCKESLLRCAEYVDCF